MRLGPVWTNSIGGVVHWLFEYMALIQVYTLFWGENVLTISKPKIDLEHPKAKFHNQLFCIFYSHRLNYFRDISFNLLLPSNYESDAKWIIS